MSRDTQNNDDPKPVNIFEKVSLSHKNTPKEFYQYLARKGWQVMDIPAQNGNSLFESISFHMFGYTNQHYAIRQDCCRQMQSDRNQFGGLGEMMSPIGTKPNFVNIGLVLKALSIVCGRQIEIYGGDIDKPMMVYPVKKMHNIPIRLAYFSDGAGSYVIKPIVATSEYPVRDYSWGKRQGSNFI